MYGPQIACDLKALTPWLLFQKVFQHGKSVLTKGLNVDLKITGQIPLNQEGILPEFKRIF